MHFRHRHTLWRGLAVGGLALLMVAVPATAALGQKAGHHDPAHDVIKRTKKSDVIAANNKAGDLVHVRFVHTSRRLVTSARVRDYRGEWHYHGLIKTPTRAYHVGGEGQGAFSIIGLSTAKGTHDIRCPALSTNIERAKNTISVSVPTTCLHRPRWVRTGLIYEWINARGDYFDDALRDSRVLDKPALTRRLYTS